VLNLKDDLHHNRFRLAMHSVAIALALFLVSACTTVAPDTVTAFSVGVSDVRKQSDMAFQSANRLARDASIQLVLSSPMPGLSEDRFVVAVNASDIAQWDNAFAGLQSYAQALQSLLSPDKSKAASDAAVELATELKEGHANKELPAGVSAAFTQIGEAAIQAAQQHDALLAMQKADPGVRLALTAMANAIGQDPRGKSPAQLKDTGLMGTVYSNWQAALGPSVIQFAQATAAGTKGERKAALDDYLQVLDRRDAELDALTSLRRSLVLLADTHSAASRGQQQDTAALITLISQQLDETKSLFGRFSEVENKEEK
jgi:hypothetical protein